jgi:hypothetical protein
VSSVKGPLWKLAVGWAIVIAVLYAGDRIPRLPFLLDLVGRLPSWLVAAGGIAWGLSLLVLVAAGIAPRSVGSRPRLALPGLAGAIVLMPLPIYLLRQDDAGQSELGLVLGFIYIGVLLTNWIAFLVHARAERKRSERTGTP